jgi:hypothetical protein
MRRLVIAAVAAGLLAIAAPAQARVTTVATGLTNPRHLHFGPDGALYVAEAGIGGDTRATTCPPVDNQFSQPGPYGAGFTGRISRILPSGRRETVADHLPSVHDGFGDALGPTDLAWIGRTLYAVIEGGGCSRGLPKHPAGVIRIKPNGSYRYVADISAFTRANPVAVEPQCGPAGDCEPDGVPHTLLAVGDKLYIVDTNHNGVLRVNPKTGSVRRIYDLSTTDPAPIKLIHRRGRFLLGGFHGLIQRFDDRFGPVETFDSGYGPIVDMAFAHRRLYLLETFAPEAPWSLDTGRIIRRNRDGSRTVIASDLPTPIGMVRRRGALYVSTFSWGRGTVRGLGKIIRVGL